MEMGATALSHIMPALLETNEDDFVLQIHIKSKMKLAIWRMCISL